MTFYEFYRMGVPVFVPSLDLLVQWHLKYRLLAQRSFPLTWRRPQRRSLVPGFYEAGEYYSTSSDGEGWDEEKDEDIRQLFRHDPNDEFSETAVRAWARLSDYYVWPHVQTFDSFEDLLQQLQPGPALLTRLQAVSSGMLSFSDKLARETQRAWGAVVKGVEQDRKFRAPPGTYPSFDAALAQQYGRSVAPPGGGGDCYAEASVAPESGTKAAS
jgi:hypothetical protein